MNYRHAFHAGNFADVMKHAILLRLLRGLCARGPSLLVIDTHAGAGVYDLRGAEAVRTGEASTGVNRLMNDASAPDVFGLLKAAVARANRRGETRYYPGSPLLVTDALRPKDRYVGCELRADDHAALKAILPRGAGALALREDGWLVGRRHPLIPSDQLLVFVDPPYEQPNDAGLAAALVAETLRRQPHASLAVWLPIKDLTSFDETLVGLEAAAGAAAILVAQARLRPLDNPLVLNGCALVVINPTSGLDQEAREVVEWVARALGEPDALGRVTAS